MKISEPITCPHCNQVDNYIFHDSTKNIECNYCSKPIDIKIQVKVEVIASKPDRVCNICYHEFESSVAYEDKVECPNCNSETYNYKIN